MLGGRLLSGPAFGFKSRLLQTLRFQAPRVRSHVESFHLQTWMSYVLFKMPCRVRPSMLTIGLTPHRSPIKTRFVVVSHVAACGSVDLGPSAMDPAVLHPKTTIESHLSRSMCANHNITFMICGFFVIDELRGRPLRNLNFEPSDRSLATHTRIRRMRSVRRMRRIKSTSKIN